MSPNHLINEKSPYLLQHAHNPVDWHAWSDETFAKARTENKPVFLSIGYATCHWCHVMEKESFEDEEAAGYLNDTFICIKVDREERPDIDAVYMAACQMLTGSGGWPLSIFMTPDKKPFSAATYLPKNSRFGRAGLIEICQQIKHLWNSDIRKVNASAHSIAAGLEKAFDYASADEPDETLLERTYDLIEPSYDSRFGGFDQAPKFPTPHRLLFLLRCHDRNGKANPKALEMVRKTLTAMRLGGIWDHVGFGFHRYSTDVQWLLPHFEKMLYDQALIALAYLEAYQITKDVFFARTAEEIFTYVLRDMTSTEGAFFSAEDADSEGEEGKFYVWSSKEFRKVLGDEAASLWEKILNINPDGNFQDEAGGHDTGLNIPHLTQPLSQWATELGISEDELEQTWQDIRTRLFTVRKQRIHPLRDDKVLTDWNGLMIAAFALGARVLQKEEYAIVARKAAEFILTKMQDEEGQLYHRFREGQLAVKAQASDYAFLSYGLLHLYQATFDLKYAEAAISLQKRMLNDFWDDEKGGLFSVSAGSQDTPIRPKELYDGALPSANSVAFYNLLMLSRLTGDSAWESKARQQVRAFAGTLQSQPTAFTFFLLGLDFALRPGAEIVITGKPNDVDTQRLLSALDLNFAPNKVALLKSEQNADRLAKFAGYTDGLQIVEEQATAHLCQGFACKDQTSDADSLIKQLMKGN